MIASPPESIGFVTPAIFVLLLVDAVVLVIAYVL